jgi:uncharacterized membrane protein HdeD (DUF308 family)
MISDEVRSLYNRSKWALVVRGLLGIALGIFIVSRPLDSVAALALVIAIWALADGVVNMVHAVDLRSIAPHWWVMFLAGVVSTLFGIAALYYYPALSLSFAVVWTGLWLITAGVLAAYIAIQERNAHLSWGWTMAFGVIAILGGILAFMYPSITLAGLISVLAAFGLVGGIAMLIGAGKMQSFQNDLGRAIHKPANVAR